MTRKWKIQKLKVSKSLKKYSNQILKSRITNLNSFIKKYFKYQTVDSLHKVRIALRSVRYSMELLIICYNKKLFLEFYNNI